MRESGDGEGREKGRWEEERRGRRGEMQAKGLER